MMFHRSRLATHEHIKMAEERIQKRGAQKHTKMAEWVTKKGCTKYLRKVRRGRKGLCKTLEERVEGKKKGIQNT